MDKKSLDLCCLGIESTAHTFGVSVLSGRKVLSNERKSVTTEEGGMIPFQVARHHVDCCEQVITAALQKAGKTIHDVDLISVSSSPGMGHALRIGCVAARTLALLHNIPLVGVNHCIAHLEIGHLLTTAKDPILCYVSGANMQIIAFAEGRYRVVGETLDIGIGNLLDSVARYMGLGFPGGPKIAALAEKHTSGDLLEVPYTVKGMDMGFAGLETFIRKHVDAGTPLPLIAYSLQETVFAMVCEVTERALAHMYKDEVLLGGGVACNTRLQEMMEAMCAARGATSYVLENQFNVDNAAMIAWHGLQVYASQGSIPAAKLGFDPFLRTDEVHVSWK